MKEYKVVCTVDTINAKGETRHIKTTSPILSGSNRMREVTTDIERAKMLLGKAEREGKKHEEWTRKMAETYKDTFIITQTNYRILSREVTEWQEVDR